MCFVQRDQQIHWVINTQIGRPCDKGEQENNKKLLLAQPLVDYDTRS